MLALYHERCLTLAASSPDLKLKYGAILVWDGMVIGAGFNHPAPGYRCEDCPRIKDRSIKSGTQLERCYAIHAEQAALFDAIEKGYARQLTRSTLWIAGMTPEGEPQILERPGFYCSFCSRILAEAGIQTVMVATTAGPIPLTQEQYLASSFAVAEGRQEAY